MCFERLQQVRVVWLQKCFAQDPCGDVGYQGIGRAELSLSFVAWIRVVFGFVTEFHEESGWTNLVV